MSMIFKKVNQDCFCFSEDGFLFSGKYFAIVFGCPLQKVIKSKKQAKNQAD